MSSPVVLRQMVALRSGGDGVVDADPAWEEKHKLATRCLWCNTWRADVPYAPIDAALYKKPRDLICTTGLFEVVYRPLAAVLLPYGRGMVVGTCRLARTEEVLEDWVTLYSKREDVLEVQRGRYSRHSQCRACASIHPRNGWAHEVILERDLDASWLYLDAYDSLFADARLIAEENIKERFPNPKLRMYPVPVVPEPLDGEVLPGDPGWDGVFKKTPLPIPPKTPPVRGSGHLWL